MFGPCASKRNSAIVTWWLTSPFAAPCPMKRVPSSPSHCFGVHYPVVLVSNTSPGTVGRVAGNAYGYLYYDAHYKGRLFDHRARDANIAEWEATATPAVRAEQDELPAGRRPRRLFALSSALASRRLPLPVHRLEHSL